MPLETAEETTITVEFGTSTQYFDFMRTARFVVMYNGALHTLIPTSDENGGKLLAPDGQMIAYWRYWETPTLQEYITLAPGRADWRLIAIYTDGGVYQLKPQDLVGLKIHDSTSPSLIIDQLMSGIEVPFVFNGCLITGRLDTSAHNAHLKICKCNPDEASKAASYELDFVDSNGIITTYSCSTFDGSSLASDLKDFLVDNVGFQPQQVTAGVFDGYLTDVPIPLGFYEL